MCFVGKNGCEGQAPLYDNRSQDNYDEGPAKAEAKADRCANGSACGDDSANASTYTAADSGTDSRCYTAAQNCTPDYDPCLPPMSDYDCEGGSGNGPGYTGYVTVTGPDIYDLDRDGNGVGCQ